MLTFELNMKTAFFISLIFLLSFCSQRDHHYDLVISNVNIIDPVNQTIRPQQTIFIRNGLISRISKGPYRSKDNWLIDGTGKFAISGFWNMHTHVCWKDDLDQTLFPVLLSYGITGIRDMGGALHILRDFKRQIDLIPASGPLLYGPGPFIDGENPIHPDFSVALTEQNFQATLDSLYNAEADFFKVYSLLPKELMTKIADYSQSRNIHFAGHISEYLSPTEAAELGQKSFEHLNRIEEIRNDSAQLDSFVKAVKANGSWLCPTLIIYKRKIELAEGRDLSHPLYEVIDDHLKAEWSQIKDQRESAGSDPDNLEALRSTYQEQKRLLQWLYQKEVSMLLGTDFGGMAFIYPGLGLHEEMAAMQDLRFNTYDILKMATYHPALYFNIEQTHGTIEKGKAADIVILNKNPVEDITNTLEIAAVIRAGIEVKLIPNAAVTK